MDWQFSPFFLIIAGSGVLSFVLGLYAARRLEKPGAKALMIILFSSAIWSFLYVVQLAVIDLPLKLILAKLQYPAVLAIPVAWLDFAYHYRKGRSGLSRTQLTVLISIAIILIGFLFTNQYHGLMWENIRLNTQGNLTVISRDFHVGFWALVVFSYLPLIYGAIIIIGVHFRSRHLYRSQSMALLTGLVLVWIPNIAYLAELTRIDYSPVFFTLSGVAFMLAIFRFHLLDVLPVAKDLVIDGMQDATLILDQDNRILDMNRAAKGLFPEGTTHFIGHRIESLAPQVATIVEQTIDADTQKQEFEIQPNDTTRIFNVNASPLKDYSGALLSRVLVFRDITQQKQYEIRLMQSQKLEALGQIAGGIAHDFNNVMATISGAMQFVEMKTDTGEIEKYLEMMQAGIERGKSVTERLQTFIRSGEPELKPLPVDKFFDDFREIASHTLPKNIRIETENSAGPIALLAEPNQLQQVLINMCINSSLAMPDGGTIEITVRAPRKEELLQNPPDADTSYLCLEVRDHGSGMDPQTQERLFEPFFTTREHGEGTGLGLAVAHKIISNHKGWIEVSSTIDHGTTFFIFLSQAESMPPPETEQSLDEIPEGQNERILFVEDEANLQDLVQQTLHQKGHQVTVAETGRQGLEIYEQQPEDFDLVITDLGLPEMNGKDLVRQLREKYPETKIIVATGHVNETEHQQLLDLGVEAVIHKPFQFAKVLRAVRSALR